MKILRQTANGNPGKQTLTDVLRSCLACGVISVDAEGTITSFNPAAQELTGLESKDLLNQSSARLPAPIRRILEKTTRSGRPIEGQEITVTHPNRGQLAIRVTTHPVAFPTHHGVTLILNELPAPHLLEEQIEQFDRLASLGTLSASMAHEIKNALVPVRTFLDLLTEHGDANELGDLVKKEINRVDFIVGQMLRFAGPQKPTFTPVSIHDILQLAVNLTRRHIEHRRITLVTAFQAECDRVLGDNYQLEAAFMNLLFNGAEATQPNGRLTVRTELARSPNLTSPILRISFQDTGNGIPPEAMNRLFEPFFTTKTDGTGLGLNITYHILTQHHGTVDVTSQVGQGTTFTLSLPILSESSPPPSQP